MKRRYHFHLATVAYVGLAALVGVAAANRPNNLLVWVFGLMLAAVLLSGLISGLMLMGLRVVRLDPRRARVGEPMVVRYSLSNRNRLVPCFGVRIEELDAPGDWGRTQRRGIDVRSPSTVLRSLRARWTSGGQGGTAGPGAGATAGETASAAAERSAAAWVLHVGAGEVVHGEAVIWPTRRGRLRLDRIRLSSGFPFGLLHKSLTASQGQEFLVHPRTVALKPSVLNAVRGGGGDGIRASRRIGAGEEYYGVRDYRIGDSMRQISWRRSAALDQPITIERTAPSPPRLRVVLDLRTPTESLRVPAGADARQLEEDAISLAGSVLRLAERNGFEVGVTVLGAEPTEATPLRHGHWHTERLMAALAAIDLDAPRVDRVPQALADAERAGLVIVAADRVDPTAVGAGAAGALMLTARHLHDLAIPDAEEQPAATPRTNRDAGAAA